MVAQERRKIIRKIRKSGKIKCPVGVTAMKIFKKIEEKNGEEKTLNF